MVRRDSDRGYHTGGILKASTSPLPGRVPREQLRESSRAAFLDGTSSGASPHADPSTGDLRSQKVQGPQPTSGARAANRPCLRYNSTLPCTWRHRKASPTAAIECPPAQTRCLPPQILLPGDRPRTSTKVVGTSLGIAVPKPRPLTRPPPRSLVYRPPTPPLADRIKPLGLITVKDLPSRQQATSESRPRQSSKPPAPQVPTAGPEGLVSRASQENNRKEACLLEWQEILLLMGSASGLQPGNSKYPQALLKKKPREVYSGNSREISCRGQAIPRFSWPQ